MTRPVRFADTRPPVFYAWMHCPNTRFLWHFVIGVRAEYGRTLCGVDQPFTALRRAPSLRLRCVRCTVLLEQSPSLRVPVA